MKTGAEAALTRVQRLVVSTANRPGKGRRGAEPTARRTTGLRQPHANRNSNTGLVVIIESTELPMIRAADHSDDSDASRLDTSHQTRVTTHVDTSHLNCETMYAEIKSRPVDAKPSARGPALRARPLDGAVAAAVAAVTCASASGGLRGTGRHLARSMSSPIPNHHQSNDSRAASRSAVRPLDRGPDGTTRARGCEDFSACPTRIINGTHPPTRC